METLKSLQPLDKFSEKYFFDYELFKDGVLLPIPEGIDLSDEAITQPGTAQMASNAKTGILIYSVGSYLVVLNKKGLIKLVESVRNKGEQTDRPNLEEYQKAGLATCIKFDSTALGADADAKIDRIRIKELSDSELLVAVGLGNKIIVTNVFPCFIGSSSALLYTLEHDGGFQNFDFNGKDVIALTKTGTAICNTQPTDKGVQEAVDYLNSQRTKIVRCSIS